mmetsp:Transcript_77274/g.201391  ORF Transcript_77274/g.201391 Transcript_77274/m.201391 type:complete len:405 (-) Transcript_77274:225-1439(-)
MWERHIRPRVRGERWSFDQHDERRQGVHPARRDGVWLVQALLVRRDAGLRRRPRFRDGHRVAGGYWTRRQPHLRLLRVAAVQRCAPGQRPERRRHAARGPDRHRLHGGAGGCARLPAGRLLQRGHGRRGGALRRRALPRQRLLLGPGARPDAARNLQAVLVQGRLGALRVRRPWRGLPGAGGLHQGGHQRRVAVPAAAAGPGAEGLAGDVAAVPAGGAAAVPVLPGDRRRPRRVEEAADAHRPRRLLHQEAADGARAGPGKGHGHVQDQPGARHARRRARAALRGGGGPREEPGRDPRHVWPAIHRRAGQRQRGEHRLPDLAAQLQGVQPQVQPFVAAGGRPQGRAGERRRRGLIGGQHGRRPPGRVVAAPRRAARAARPPQPALAAARRVRLRVFCVRLYSCW